MPRHAKLQFVGPATLFAMMLCGEGAVHALGLWPSSSALWYIKLELFGLFQKSHCILSTYSETGYPQLLLVGLPLFAVACYGFFFNRLLALAIAGNLGFVYVAFLLWNRYLCGASAQGASPVTTSSGIEICVWFALVGSSILSCMMSHVVYLRAIHSESPWPPIPIPSYAPDRMI